MDPVLVLCAHGTASPRGRAVIDELVGQARERLAGIEVHPAYVDVQDPGIDDVVDRLVARDRRCVVVPLLLSGGFHVVVDIARAVGRHPGRATATPALGPDPLLTSIVLDRLAEQGIRPDDAIVLAAAGSSRDSGTEAARVTAAELSDALARPVAVAYGAGAQPSVSEAVRAARDTAGSRVVVASFHLTPGYFHDQLGRSGADVIADALGADPRIIDVIATRLRAGSSVSDDDSGR